MPINPEIALQVRTPAPPESPLEAYGKVMSLRNMQQQQQSGALELQQKQMAIDQTKALNAAYQGALTVGADGAADIDQGKLTTALGRGGHGSAIPGVLKSITEFKKSTADLAKLNGEVAAQQANYGGGIGATVKAANNDPHLFLTLTQHGMNAKALDPQHANQFIQRVQQAMEQDPSGDTARQLVGQISDQLIQQSPEQQKLGNEKINADAARSRAASAATSAQTGADKLALEKPELQAKADTAVLQNASQQLGAAGDMQSYARVYGALPAQVASRFPNPGTFDPKKTPALVRQLGMSAEQQTQAGQAAANASETHQQHQQTNTFEQARIRIESSRNQREQNIYNQTYGEGANPALVGVPANLRTQALSQAQKAANEYQTSQRVADDMESLIQMTRSGNKAAGSNLPLVGVETINALNGIKRINRAEIDTYAGAGSLLDRISGKIGKLTVGQPIPKDVLDDIEAMHRTLRENGTKGYNDKLAGINQNYKSNFQPVKVSAANPPAGGHKAGDVVNVGGKKVKISAIHADGTFDGDEVKQ